ncbi:bifunctional protein-disulfide isomerase/oxidoreductase DsbC [Aggregatibacter actinomycetemcomitans]|uniref:bifunctional protein-disulfide isomerase/oxidoreductase DsbC n=1 Tax=Aggregatibacter actinomycetemcomitans TaxID=714 RepID=UPI0001B9F833|nr:bifunctional protein-disulfide isomerase/oxidoreductase DsbC [Aggregatibacter actinomycetemcomitans]AEW77363.1 thiol:disulfide interchange protein DsbC [Aggregatibacter actinomycetemcomitans ANH9381]ACX82470.1 protein-disulfide isomerase [Aggregatibacter actinomycetemcomitans D11S-1]AHN72026.1 Thiol:disulfide interchange protein DsbC,putative' [Aggregatibacter actinomycetemcomitans HK1651]KND82794.1 protein-disulfide isomerase [Aggregatibacter actinomycetemcomitans serotype b str. SCC1398]K
MKKIITTLSLLAISMSVTANDVALKSKLEKLGVKDIDIQTSPIKGLKTVVSDQGIFYASEDGEYLLQGKIYKLTDKGISNVTNKVLLDKLNALKNEMIVYPAKNEKHVITVFMDITCHYCHLLHQQVKEYNDLGITVRYLAFPRAGMESQTAGQMEAIFTAKDPTFALNEAEKGNLPKELKTPNVVRKHYLLGAQFGVNGTPTIITSEGEVIGGYLKPADLLAALEG